MKPKGKSLFVAVALMFSAEAFSQTCNSDITVQKPDSRYVDHGDGTVTDKATGLMWQQCASGLSGSDCATGTATEANWRNALKQSGDGYNDWRLPNKNELTSLLEDACITPALNATFFPNTPAESFWSSTPFASTVLDVGDGEGGSPDSDPNCNPVCGWADAWAIDFDTGATEKQDKDQLLLIRLVRSAD